MCYHVLFTIVTYVVKLHIRQCLWFVFHAHYPEPVPDLPIHFHLQIKVKLQNERAARDLWDVLEDFPPQAVLLNTHLLHCVLDLVGAPFSQADVGKLPNFQQ